MAQFNGLGLLGSSNQNIEDALIKFNRSLEYQMDGHLDSVNIQEVGGWNVTPTELSSKDFDVGMSTDDSGVNPVRFWAGSAAKETAPWRIHQDGSMYALGYVEVNSFADIFSSVDGETLDTRLNSIVARFG